MACSCKQNKGKFEVVASSGKVVYRTTTRNAAEAVSRRYAGSTVQCVGDNCPK